MNKRSSTSWIESQKCWSGEAIPARRMEWAQMNQKRLLKVQTKAERYFGKSMSGVVRDGRSILRFIKQKPFHVTPEFLFYVDFYFKRFKLAVEVDGATHRSPMGLAQDQVRTTLLSAHRIRVLRFPNEEVLDDIARVSHAIIREVYKIGSKSDHNRIRTELSRVANLNPEFAERMIPLFLLQPRP